MGNLYDINGNELVSEFPIGLHQMPENEGVLNVIKRARQLTDVKWTPAVDIPRRCRDDNESFADTTGFRDVFLAGVEYTGIPYTSSKGALVERWGYTRVTTGCYTGVDTLVTAAANPDSVFCKESTYNTSIAMYAYYGCTCCGFVSYALNIPWTNTENFANLISNGKLISKGLVTASSNLELADVLWNADVHVAMITDIIKDNDGNVKYIEVSENTTHGAMNPDHQGSQFGGHARRFGWSFTDFVTKYATFTLCKYRDIASVPFTPSKFINVGDAIDMPTDANFPCVPYMGENFPYKSGYIYNSDILIATDNYSELDVYKDGTLFNTFAVASGTNKISVGFSAKGNYEAFLCNKSSGNITERSNSCHWRVV